MKIQWKKLIICILIPVATGATAAFLTRNEIAAFDSVNKPPLTPPTQLFPIAWTILYVLMGIASYLVLVSDVNSKRNSALTIYGIQLAINFLWTFIFFSLELYLFAFIWLVLLFVLVFTTLLLFRRISKAAGYLLLPYLLWTAFACYLNLGVYLLN